MKIAIEALRIFRVNKHGMDFVALEVIRELQKIDRENEYFILVNAGEDRCLEESENMHIVTVNAPLYPLWEQVCLPEAVRRIGPDILHCTGNTAPLRCDVPLVLTLHDIIFLEKRSGSSPSWYRNMAWYYRRFVVYNGYGSHFRPVESPYEVTRKYLPEKEYLFFLGNTDPKKNTARTLRAYALYARQTERPLPLLVADIPENVIDGILKELQISDVKPLLRLPGYIPNGDLPSVYCGAKIFLYTSLRESFGIPMLEAMACGTPVVTSDTSAMPEVAGSGAVLVDPTDETQIAGAVRRLLDDPQLYERQRAYGLERVKQFSWRKTAEQTLDVYKSVGL